MAVRHDLELRVSQPARDGDSTLAHRNDRVEVTHQAVVLTHEGGHLPEPALIVQGRSLSLGVAEVIEDPFRLAERMQRVAEIEADIDCTLDHLAALRKVLEGAQGLLEACHGLPVGGARRCGTPGLLEVPHRLLPRVSSESMMRKRSEEHTSELQSLAYLVCR